MQVICMMMDWQARQAWMEREYESLLEDADHAAEGYENDFRGIAELLGRFSGRVLDIGGGNGIARHWLPDAADYMLLEPSLMWRDPRWTRLSTRFPCLGRSCPTVRAYAEAIPFAAGRFDAALCLWSLNHVASPRQAIDEALRVLKPCGRLLVTLEDMLPSWGDLHSKAYPHATGPRAFFAKFTAPVAGWPRQADHVAVSERLFLQARGSRVRQRAWRGAYLTLELEKL
jgi:SAM-dependent methyltransferase